MARKYTQIITSDKLWVVVFFNFSFPQGFYFYVEITF